MAGWDETAPANSGSEITTENAKIRNNWTEIHTTTNVDHFAMADPVSATDGQHRQVTLPKLSTDPNGGVQVVETGFAYTKIWTDPAAAEYTEMYYMDGEATPNIVQMTKRGQPFGAPAAWCVFTNAAGAVSSFNATATGSGGSYTVTFDNDMSSTNYVVVATCVGSSSGATGSTVAFYHTPAAGSVGIYTYTLKPNDNSVTHTAAVGNISVAIYDL